MDPLFELRDWILLRLIDYFEGSSLFQNSKQGILRFHTFIMDEAKHEWRWSSRYDLEIAFWKKSLLYFKRKLLSVFQNVFLFRYDYDDYVSHFYSAFLCSRHFRSSLRWMVHVRSIMDIASSHNSHFDSPFAIWCWRRDVFIFLKKLRKMNDVNRSAFSFEAF